MQAEGLEEYIRCKLQHRIQAEPDAASTSLALWLLEAILSRTYGASAPTMQGIALAGIPYTGAGTEAGTAAPETHFSGQAPRNAVAEVTEFVCAYQKWLPYKAVEQILLASGCQEHLKEVARLFAAWQTAFNLSVASALLTYQQWYRLLTLHSCPG
jgi:hypothetical protein